MYDFKKSGSGYFVYRNDKLLGHVRKIEGWTVRGRPVRWEAFRKGRMIGSETSRFAAAALLEQTA